MTLRCLAIDDEPLALKQLVAYISKVQFLELAAQCQSALEAREFLENDTVDAIFCDINMPDLNGMDFVKSLAVPPLVVFTTAYSEYAVEGFRVNAVDYLLKPFGFQEFQRAAQRLLERKMVVSPLPFPKEEADTLFLKTDNRIVNVNISDIRYIEAMSEYLKVWLDSQPKPVITLLSMKKIEEEYLTLIFTVISNKMKKILALLCCVRACRCDDERSGLSVSGRVFVCSMRWIGKSSPTG